MWDTPSYYDTAYKVTNEPSRKNGNAIKLKHSRSLMKIES